VAWDVDGTMVDSEPLHHRALVAVSGRYGVDIALDDDRFVGVGMDHVWIALRGRYPAELTQNRWMNEIVDAYLADAASLAIYDRLMDTVLAFHRTGIVQCCVSNSARAIVDANIARLAIADLIAFSISRDDVRHPKPDPEPYALACRRLGIAPANVLCFEDSASGSASAIAAGCRLLRFGRDFSEYGELSTRASLRDLFCGSRTGFPA
jgi:HAD superfamily hydrolase (TIGR01509 family)